MTLTYKNKFNKKYGFQKDTSHSISNISKLTGYKKAGLEIIYSAVMGGKAARVDATHLIKK